MTAPTIAFLAAALITSTTNGATLQGKSVPPGGTLDLEFPLSDYFQNYAAQGANPRPSTARALMYFPKDFDPAHACPILVVASTSDVGHTSLIDAPYYRSAAMKEGWMVLAADATIRPRVDLVTWRLGVTAAALQMVRQNWPQAADWPIALAGFSGGAKLSGRLGPMLAATGKIRIAGIFMRGVNSDHLSAAYNEVHPGADFLNVPVWISGGSDDKIAPPATEQLVYYSIKRAGFRQVRLEQYFGGHRFNSAQIQAALQWFRQIGKF